MAAVIAASAFTVAADGKTLTATLSGGTGPYTIASTAGLGPYILSGNNPFFYVSAATVVGTTLTVTILSPIGIGEVVKFSLSAASTISDSLANTVVVNGALVVTNNSALAVTIIEPSSTPNGFEINGAFGIQLGGFSTGVGSGFGDASIEFVTDATEIGIISYSNGFSSNVDQAAAVGSVMNPMQAWGVQAVTTSALAAGKHLIRYWGVYLNQVRLFGGTRSLFTVPSTKRTATANTLAGVQTPQATPVSLTGAQTPWNGGRGDVLTGNYVGVFVEFAYTGTGVEVSTLSHVNSSWTVSNDDGYEGQIIGIGDAATNNQVQYLPLTVGLPSGAHTFRGMLLSIGGNTPILGVRVINGTYLTIAPSAGATSITTKNTQGIAAGDWVRIGNLGKREVRIVTAPVLNGDTTTTWTVAALTQAHAIGEAVTSYMAPAGTITPYQKYLYSKRAVLMGDSNTHGANDLGFAGTPDVNGVYYNWYDPRTTGEFTVCNALGIEPVNLGIQGTDTINQAARKADITTYSKGAYDFVLIMEGTNDINSNTVTPAELQTNIQAQITTALTGLRPGGLVLLMPISTPNATSAKGVSPDVVSTTLKTLAATNGPKVVYAGQIMSTMTAPDHSGTLHFTLSGQRKIGEQLRPHLTGLLHTFGAAV